MKENAKTTDFKPNDFVIFAQTTKIVAKENIPVRAGGGDVKSIMCPPYSPRVVNWGGLSESPYKKVGPMSVLGRGR